MPFRRRYSSRRKRAGSPSSRAPESPPVTATAQLRPGDTLYVMAGTFSADTSNFLRSGMDIAPIVVKPLDPSVKPKMAGNATSFSGDYAMDVNGHDWITIDGLEIVGDLERHAGLADTGEDRNRRASINARPGQEEKQQLDRLPNKEVR